MRKFIVFKRGNNIAVAKFKVNDRRIGKETDAEVIAREAETITDGPWFAIGEADAPKEHPQFWTVDFAAKTIVSDKAASGKYQLDMQWLGVRQKRNQLLADSDWTQVQDAPVNNTASWKTYRQALRDITKSASPAAVVWPKAPA